jgi:hypothetical protein
MEVMERKNSNVYKNILGFITGVLVVYLIGKYGCGVLACLLGREDQCPSKNDSKKMKGKSAVHKKEVETDYPNLSMRKQKIMEIITKNKSLTVPELSDRFPEVSDRTLRRDMNALEDMGLVKRHGSTKATEYRLG